MTALRQWSRSWGPRIAGLFVWTYGAFLVGTAWDNRTAFHWNTQIDPVGAGAFLTSLLLGFVLYLFFERHKFSDQLAKTAARESLARVVRELDILLAYLDTGAFEYSRLVELSTLCRRTFDQHVETTTLLKLPEFADEALSYRTQVTKLKNLVTDSSRHGEQERTLVVDGLKATMAPERIAQAKLKVRECLRLIAERDALIITFV